MNSLNQDSGSHASQSAEQKQEDILWHWDEMQEGIFTKITREDPDFFNSGRKRRMTGLLIFGILGTSLLLFLAGVMGTRYWRSGQHQSAKLKYAQTENATRKSSDSKGNTGSSSLHSSGNQVAVKGEYASIAEKGKALSPSQNKLSPGAPFNIENPVTINSIHLGTHSEHAPLAHGDSEMEYVKPKPVLPLEEKEYEFGANLQQMKPVQRVANGSKWSLSLMAVGSYSTALLPGSSPAAQLRNSATGSMLGVGTGMRLEWNNKGRLGWYISGSVQQLQQTIDVFSQRRVNYLQRNAVVGINTYIGSNRSELVYKDTLIKATENNRLISRQTVNAIALEGGLSKTFAHRAWNLQVLLGARASYLIHGKGYTVGEDFGIIPLSQWQNAVNRGYLSLNSDFLLHRKLNNDCSIWFGPGFNVAIVDQTHGKGPLGRAWNVQWSMGLRKQL